MSTVVTFLTVQFNMGVSYGTMNSHRSALSIFLGNDIGSEDMVKRLLKGAFRLRPSVPKYSFTWDPQIVLNHISLWFPNTDLTLEKVTKKLVILLALCTAHRVQTFSLIKLCNIHIIPSGVKIYIKDIIKTSAPGREQPVLYLPSFTDNLSICPVKVIQDYLSLTRELRPQSVEHLLITFKRPHRPATAQTVSRWIKQVLAESGVDVATFSAHSTRHAATSAASVAGVSVDVIRKTAGWTSGSQTFARFYHREVLPDEGTFAKSVCLDSNT